MRNAESFSVCSIQVPKTKNENTKGEEPSCTLIEIDDSSFGKQTTKESGNDPQC